MMLFGEASVSCWARNGKRVAPQRGAAETFVGAEVERLKRVRRMKAVVVGRIMKIVLQAIEDSDKSCTQ